MKVRTKFKETEIGMIPEDWEVKSISELSEISLGGTPSTTVKEYWDGKIKWASAKDISNAKGRYVYDTEKRITEEGIANSAAKILPKNTIIITSRGTVGEMAMLSEPMSFNQTCYGLKAKTVNDTYLYYRLKSALNHFKKVSYGTVFNTITMRSFDEIKLAIPTSENEQLSIAKILSDLDSKIELNQQMNATLEKIGQALFKRWFIEFEFPNEKGKPYKSSGGKMVDSELGEIPKGWEIKPLCEVASFLRGFSYSGAEKYSTPNGYVFITLNNVKEGGGFKPEYAWIKSDRLKERHFLKEKDLIITNTEQTKDGRLLAFPAIVYFPKDYEEKIGVFSHHITRVVPKHTNSKYFVYYFLLMTQNESVAFHTGSVIWGLDVNNFANHRHVVWAPTDIMMKFDEIAETLFEKKILNQIEMSGLSRIRDSLLPRLMSGKIRVNAHGSGGCC